MKRRMPVLRAELEALCLKAIRRVPMCQQVESVELAAAEGDSPNWHLRSTTPALSPVAMLEAEEALQPLSKRYQMRERPVAASETQSRQSIEPSTGLHQHQLQSFLDTAIRHGERTGRLLERRRALIEERRQMGKSTATAEEGLKQMIQIHQLHLDHVTRLSELVASMDKE